MTAEEYEKYHGKYGMVGDSKEMKRLYEDIEIAASNDETVFIVAESGTGKELVARAIHDNSSRKEKRYTKFNCAAVPVELLESELFGHMKGAFTGAYATRKGKFQATEGGTFFLDEIADMNPSLQPKILRVLEYREFEKVGGNDPIKVDVRLIAATSKNVKNLINENKFRPELFYRVNFFPLYITPLRERRDDIQLMIYYFIEKYGGKGIEKDALIRLTSYDWPGNVRELKSVIGRLVLRSNYDKISRKLVEEYGGVDGELNIMKERDNTISDITGSKSGYSDLDAFQQEIETKVKRVGNDLEFLKKYMDTYERNREHIKDMFENLSKLEIGYSGKKARRKTREKRKHTEDSQKPETEPEKYLSAYRLSELMEIPISTIYGMSRREFAKPPEERSLKCAVNEGEIVTTMDDLSTYFKSKKRSQYAIKQIESYIKEHPGSESLEIHIKRRPRG